MESNLLFAIGSTYINLLVRLGNLKRNRLTIKIMNNARKNGKNDIYQTLHLTVMDHFIIQISNVMICQKVMLNF